VENDEKLSIAVFGTLEDKIREELKTLKIINRLTLKLANQPKLIKLIRNAFKNVENSLPTATAIRLKKSLESHSIMILEKKI
jgi:hypothetical protein